MLLKASDRPMATEAAVPAPESEADRAAAPVMASMVARFSARTVMDSASSVKGSAGLPSTPACKLELMRFSA